MFVNFSQLAVKRVYYAKQHTTDRVFISLRVRGWHSIVILSVKKEHKPFTFITYKYRALDCFSFSGHLYCVLQQLELEVNKPIIINIKQQITV